MRCAFEQHLRRVECWPPGDAGPIVIDPGIAFGRRVVAENGVSRAAIADQIDAGETINGVAADYDLLPAHIEQAVLYERAV